jgi:hypothetical protein
MRSGSRGGVSVKTCRGCGVELEPSVGGRERVWCSDRCRKAAKSVRPATGRKATDSGPVETATRALVEEYSDRWDTKQRAMGELAIALATMTDAGSVPAGAQLRQLFEDLDAVDPSPDAEFWRAVRTPGQGGLS